MVYKVIQWATGYTARQAVQAMAERPEFEIVAGRVYDPAKAGRDLGEICGTRRLGIEATTDSKKIIDTPADCVIYMGSAEGNLQACTKDICDLLASGKNVIATSTPYIFPRALGPEFAEPIERACEKGRSTFHGLGIMPGFVSESIPLLMTRVSRRVDQLVAYETLLYNEYPSHNLMFNVMGFGFPPDDPTPLFSDAAVAGGTCWRGSALLVAEALGLKVDEVQNFRQTVVTPKDLQVASGFIPKGTVAAMNFGVRVISAGRPAIVFQHYTRMDPDLAPDWPRGEGWTLLFEGLPSMSVKINVGIHGEDHTDQACWNTAMHAVHAVPYVVAAKPGLLSLADVPPVWAADVFRKL